jgi:hypothetical protein
MTSIAGNDPWLLIFALQGVWGLFLLLLTWTMKRVLKDIEENTKATKEVATSVNGINVLLAGNFVTKPEIDRLAERVRQLESEVTTLKARDDLRIFSDRRGA